MKKITFIAILFASMLAGCAESSNDIVPATSSNVELVDTFTTIQRNAIDYCYSQIWEWDYLYNSLPLVYRVPTDNRYKRLEVLCWLHENSDEWGDTIEEGDAWEIICNEVLHIEY